MNKLKGGAKKNTYRQKKNNLGQDYEDLLSLYKKLKNSFSVSQSQLLSPQQALLTAINLVERTLKEVKKRSIPNQPQVKPLFTSKTFGKKLKIYQHNKVKHFFEQ